VLLLYLLCYLMLMVTNIGFFGLHNKAFRDRSFPVGASGEFPVGVPMQ